ncbi:IS3 family transposase [Photobacterium damselae]
MEEYKIKLKGLTPIEYRNQTLNLLNRNVQLYGSLQN